MVTDSMVTFSFGWPSPGPSELSLPALAMPRMLPSPPMMVLNGV